MGGFRKVMPFTYGCIIVGGLALAGVPPFSGFFSKDEILALEFERGGWHVVLGVLGYVGAFLTAIYTFRMIFRAFHGEPCRRPRSSSTATSTTTPSRPTRRPARWRTPTSASPAPSTTSPSASAPMKVAMGVLAVLAIVGGVLQIPGVTHVAAPLPRADVRGLASSTRSSSRRRRRSGSACSIGAVIGLAGIAHRLPDLWATARERRRALQARFGGAAHASSCNKWYFDELIDS